MRKLDFKNAKPKPAKLLACALCGKPRRTGSWYCDWHADRKDAEFDAKRKDYRESEWEVGIEDDLDDMDWED